MSNPDNTATMASKRIPVTPPIWETLHDMRKPGQTYSLLIEEMIECYKARNEQV